MADKLSLPDVTICAADSAFVNLTVRALVLSMAGCSFGDAILFSDRPVHGPFRWVQIPRLDSIEAYSRFCLRGLAEFIRTRFVLVVQWDGYVINPSAWANSFYKYDYIGAPWHGGFPPGVPLVGNGGFSLRSRRLLQAVRTLPPLGGYSEDRVICHAYRSQLEQQAAIRFAPVKVADRFSYEAKVPEVMPFGFHDLTHLWRHSSEADLIMIAETADFAKLNAERLLTLIHNCYANGMLAAAAALYARYRRYFARPMIHAVLGQRIGPAASEAELSALDRLTGLG